MVNNIFCKFLGCKLTHWVLFDNGNVGVNRCKRCGRLIEGNTDPVYSIDKFRIN